MDLVRCRNLLIYLERDAQERALSLAHFALKEGGYLFLGSAETLGKRDDLFATVPKRPRIYRRAGPARGAGQQAVRRRRHRMGADEAAAAARLKARARSAIEPNRTGGRVV